MGDDDYLAVFHHILLPIAYEVTNIGVCLSENLNDYMLTGKSLQA